MKLIENRGIKYQILQSPPETSYDYYVGVAKSCPDLVLLKNNEGFLLCRIVYDAELISDDGYLYWSC